nr:hypothetical protein [Salmonella sp.]
MRMNNDRYIHRYHTLLDKNTIHQLVKNLENFMLIPLCLPDNVAAIFHAPLQMKTLSPAINFFNGVLGFAAEVAIKR